MEADATVNRRAFIGTFIPSTLIPVATAAQSFSPVTIAELLSNPAAHADKYVVVEGVVSTAQLTTMAVPGRGPDLVPILLLSHGSAGIWVAIVGGPNSEGPPSGGGPPPTGTAVRVYGIFRAGTRAIETDRGILRR